MEEGNRLSNQKDGTRRRSSKRIKELMEKFEEVGGGQNNLKHFLITVLAISEKCKDFCFFKILSLESRGLPQILVHLKSYLFW